MVFLAILNQRNRPLYCIFTCIVYLLYIGLLAQLVERCTGIAEVMGSNPVQA